MDNNQYQPNYNYVPQGNEQYQQPTYQQPQYTDPNYGQPNYGQPNYGQPMQPQAPVADNSKGMAIASLVLGILSCTICCGGMIPSILAIIFGIISKNRKPDNNGMALAGIILGAVGIVVGIIFIASGAFASFMDGFYEGFYYY